MIAMISLLPPLFWHLKAKNVPALTLLIWIFLYNLKIFVDASVWSKDIIGLMTGWDGKGWCDLMIYIEVGSYVAVPCCVCRIALQLTNIIKAENILPDKEKLSYILKDLLIVNFLPALCMLMSYFVQINRYGLITYNGCQPFLSTTWVTLILYSIWPFLASSVGTILSFRLLYLFYKKRQDAKDILHCTDSGLTLSRFSRIIFFCLLIILIMCPVSIYNFVTTCQKVTGRYSYQQNHENGSWWNIPKLSTNKPFYSVWIYMAMAYCSFFIFGTSSDSLNMYLSCLKKIGFKKIIEKWETEKQEKKQKKINEMFQAQYLSMDKDNTSFYNKVETPIEVKTPNSTWSEVSKLNFYEDNEFQYINNKLGIDNDDTVTKEYDLVNNGFENFEIDYKGVPNSKFSHNHIKMANDTDDFTVDTSVPLSDTLVHENQILSLIKKNKDKLLSSSKKNETKLKESSDDTDEMIFHYQIQRKKD
ncbi:hypothetical protein ACO0SA_002460 [Hanseniaspora valbyensis]